MCRTAFRWRRCWPGPQLSLEPGERRLLEIVPGAAQGPSVVSGYGPDAQHRTARLHLRQQRRFGKQVARMAQPIEQRRQVQQPAPATLANAGIGSENPGAIAQQLGREAQAMTMVLVQRGEMPAPLFHPAMQPGDHGSGKFGQRRIGADQRRAQKPWPVRPFPKIAMQLLRPDRSQLRLRIGERRGALSASRFDHDRAIGVGGLHQYYRQGFGDEHVPASHIGQQSRGVACLQSQLFEIARRSQLRHQPKRGAQPPPCGPQAVHRFGVCVRTRDHPRFGRQHPVMVMSDCRQHHGHGGCGGFARRSLDAFHAIDPKSRPIRIGGTIGGNRRIRTT